MQDIQDMVERVTLTSVTDGFGFEAWRTAPTDARRGGLVLLHDRFGVTDTIRGLAAAFAADGYETLTPSLFDRHRPGVEAEARPEGGSQGQDLSEATTWNEVASDLTVAVTALAPPVFVVGYGWGGAAAWLAACRVPGIAAASAYYGRRIPELLGDAPACPLILHFGRDDTSIPPETVATIADAYPDMPLHIYDAGEGFASDGRSHYQADAARLASLRTLQLFARQGVGQGEI